jgi:hypothetical protein
VANRRCQLGSQHPHSYAQMRALVMLLRPTRTGVGGGLLICHNLAMPRTTTASTLQVAKQRKVENQSKNGRHRGTTLVQPWARFHLTLSSLPSRKAS